LRARWPFVAAIAGSLTIAGAALGWLLPRLAEAQRQRAVVLDPVAGVSAEGIEAATPETVVFNTHILRRTALFGSPAATAEAVAAVALPATRLPLTLQGIFSYASPQRSRALILSEREARSYRVDDVLPGGRRIVAIRSEVVVLESAQGLEKLGFEDDAAPVGAPAAEPSPRPERTERGRAETELTREAPAPAHRLSLRERFRRG